MVGLLMSVAIFGVGFLCGFVALRMTWTRANRRLIDGLHKTARLITLTRANGDQQDEASRHVWDAITRARSFSEPSKKGFARPNQIQRTK